MNIRGSWRGWVLALAIVVVAGLAFVWLRPYYLLATGPVPEDRCPGHEQFDHRLWQDSALAFSELAPRGCMVESLLRRVRLVGMNRDEVVGLLGEPTRTAKFKDYDLVYWLGPEPGLFSIDSEWLVLKLDATGRVTSVDVMTD